jgi:hypothetical protein
VFLIYVQQHVTPKLGLKSTREKRVPSDGIRSDNQQNFSIQGAHCSNYPTISHSPCTCHTQGSVPLLCSIVLQLPHFPSKVTSNRTNKKSLSPTTNAQHTREKILANLSPEEYAHGAEKQPLQQQISHLERLLTGLKTRLFNNKSLTQGDFSRA